jgi:prepilin-type N-terminal cleavage/methylation domain-containing protein
MRFPWLPISIRRAAFTLIELLVVIAILAGMLLPALGRAKDRVLLANDLNNIKQIMLAAQLFASDNEDYLFHDVGSTPHEGISQRHAGARRPKDQKDNVGGIAPLGSLSGAAYTVRMSKWLSPDLAGQNIWPAAPNPSGPNDAWFNPDSRDGTF